MNPPLCPVWCARAARYEEAGRRGSGLPIDITAKPSQETLSERGWEQRVSWVGRFCCGLDRVLPLETGAAPQLGHFLAVAFGAFNNLAPGGTAWQAQDRRAETSDARQFPRLAVSRFHRPIMRLLRPSSLLAHVRRSYRLLTPFQTVNVTASCVTVGRDSLSLVGPACQTRRSSSKGLGSPTAGPCSCPRAVGGRPFLSGGTLKKPQTEPSRPRPQGSGKDTQMGENAKDEAPFPLTDVDKWVLSQTDDEFTYHTWDELRQLIRRTTMACFDNSSF